MPRGTGEVFACDNCGNRQPLPKNSGRSVTCFGCHTVYAVVNDGEGNRALVPFFNQPKHEEESAE